MSIDDFTVLSPEQKAELLIYKGQLDSDPESSDIIYSFYFYKKFYFEEVTLLSTNTVIETNQVQKFAHFKKYLSAIRAEKLII